MTEQKPHPDCKHDWMLYGEQDHTGRRTKERWFLRCKHCGIEQPIDRKDIVFDDQKDSSLWT